MKLTIDKIEEISRHYHTIKCAGDISNPDTIRYLIRVEHYMWLLNQWGIDPDSWWNKNGHELYMCVSVGVRSLLEIDHLPRESGVQT